MAGYQRHAHSRSGGRPGGLPYVIMREVKK